MKLPLAAVACLAGACLASSALADPVEGLWKTEADANGHTATVQIGACGAAFCGTITHAYDATGAEVAAPTVGRKVVWDMVAQGGGVYGDGKVFSPAKGKTYDGRMTLAGSSLTVDGCVMSACRAAGQWTRAD